MGERAHTPGPWRSYRDRNGRPVVKGPGTVSIADCYQPPDGDGDANARLIAAAPDMFEAGRALLAHLNAYDFNERDPSGELYERMAALNAALSKASPAPAAQTGGA